MMGNQDGMSVDGSWDFLIYICHSSRLTLLSIFLQKLTQIMEDNNDQAQQPGCSMLLENLCGEQLNGYPILSTISAFSQYLKDVSEPDSVAKLFERDFGCPTNPALMTGLSTIRYPRSVHCHEAVNAAMKAGCTAIDSKEESNTHLCKDQCVSAVGSLAKVLLDDELCTSMAQNRTEKLAKYEDICGSPESSLDTCYKGTFKETLSCGKY
jgi:hypothetical protein